jgi:hypothetical protein
MVLPSQIHRKVLHIPVRGQYSQCDLDGKVSGFLHHPTSESEPKGSERRGGLLKSFARPNGAWKRGESEEAGGCFSPGLVVGCPEKVTRSRNLIRIFVLVELRWRSQSSTNNPVEQPTSSVRPREKASLPRTIFEDQTI